MKKKIVTLFLIICVLVLPFGVYAEREASADNDYSDYTPEVTVQYDRDDQRTLDNVPEIGCKAAYVADPITGKVIYEKNAHEKMYPASTTKILTALLVMEHCEMTEQAQVSQHALDLVPEGYSSAKLRAGEVFDIKTLLYALLIPSANEAANVLAEHVSNTVDDFAALCNSRAKELGCESLHFVNPNGIHDENHYCSAYDLYLIARECSKYDVFNEIVKTKKFTVPATDVHPQRDRTFQNTNEMLLRGAYYYPYCTGIKTGHTTPAGECFVGSATNGDIDLISVVLGGSEHNSRGLNDRFDNTKQLYEFTYGNYSLRTIAEYGDLIGTIRVGKATKDTASLDVIVDTDIAAIVPNILSDEEIYSTVSVYEDIVAPIAQNQPLGEISYYADGLIYKTNIIAGHAVEKIPYARYNALIAGIILLTLILLMIALSKAKKHKKRFLYFMIVVIIIEIICLAIFGIGLYKRSKTVIPPGMTSDTTGEPTQDLSDTQYFSEAADQLNGVSHKIMDEFHRETHYSK